MRSTAHKSKCVPSSCSPSNTFPTSSFLKNKTHTFVIASPSLFFLALIWIIVFERKDIEFYILFNNQAVCSPYIYPCYPNCSSRCTFQLPHGSTLQQDLGLVQVLWPSKFWLHRKETKPYRRNRVGAFSNNCWVWTIKGWGYTTIVQTQLKISSIVL